jgi:hypothetical protein
VIDYAFTLGGVHFDVAALAAIAGTVAWLVALCFRRRKQMLFGTAALAFGWIIAFGTPLREKKVVAEAAIIPGATASCASIRTGMTGAEVRAATGKPDEIRDEEAIRGPGSAAWIYKGSRCAVHLTDDKVEMVE